MDRWKANNGSGRETANGEKCPNGDERGFDVDDDEDASSPARELEIVRRLGAGSYAVVYHVREVLSRRPARNRPASDDGCGILGVGGQNDDSDDGHGEDSGYGSSGGVHVAIAGEMREYGRDFAVKVLSKANLDDEALQAQMVEVSLLFNISLLFFSFFLSPISFRFIRVFSICSLFLFLGEHRRIFLFGISGGNARSVECSRSYRCPPRFSIISSFLASFSPFLKLLSHSLF